MTKRWFVAVLTMLMCGCTQELSANDKLIAEAKDAIKQQLKDPYSAQFENVTVKREGVVCGHVNVRNAFGGYVGRKRFVYLGTFAKGMDIEDGKFGGLLEGSETMGRPTPAGWIALDFTREIWRPYCVG